MTIKEILCTIYKGDREQELYVYVPKSSGKENIPAALLQRMGTIKEVMTVRITPELTLARAESARVLQDIRDKGFYLQLPPEISGQVLVDGD